MSNVSRFSICLVRTNIFRGFLATRRINIGIPSFLDRSRIPSGKRNSHWESSKVNLICSVNFRSHRFPPNAEMNIWRSSIFAKAATKRWNTFHTSVHYTSLKLNTRKKKKKGEKRGRLHELTTDELAFVHLKIESTLMKSIYFRE